MTEPHMMTTLSEVMNIQRDKGFHDDFEMKAHVFIHKQSGKEYKPEDLKIVKVFRFEGNSDPNDMSVLYLIESKDNKKGMLVDAFGTYSDTNADKLADFIKNIPMERDAYS
ncbi:MAG: phosphoribosylpyrophosphate synthetase [Syntrophothermus sp.]|nr:hypothetical protein [Ignavibacteriaceae bacterium]